MDVGVIVAGLSKSKKEKIRLETLIFTGPSSGECGLSDRVRPNWQGDSTSRQPHLESNLETVLLQEAEVAVRGRGVLPLSIPLPRL